MLPRTARLRRPTDFARVVRYGSRAGRSTVVVHALQSAATDPTRVGFVVSKTVGSAVTRNRVKRRLRHLAAARLGETPAGSQVVVRALPPAAAPTAPLATDLGAAWARAVQAGRA